MSDVSLEELLTKKLLIRQYAVETDIHPFVKGVTFEKVRENKVRAKFGNTFVNFASLEDLKFLLRLRRSSKKRSRKSKANS